MRVNNTSVDTLAGQTSAAAAQKVAQQNAPLSTSKGGVETSDQATLSSAANLVSLAKSFTLPSRQAKISGLTAQVRLGTYQGSTSRAGQAMVQELLQQAASPASR